MKLKRFFKWLRRDTPQQSIASKADQGDVGVKVRSEKETEDEYSDDCSVSWLGIDQADSSIFDTGRLVTEKSEDQNAVSQSTLKLEDDPLSEEDIGVDPYDTARFDTENK